MSKLIFPNEIPIKDLTEEETQHLEDIRSYIGKGYIRNYQVKYMHLCPKCNQHGWVGGTKEAGYEPGFKCTHCGHKVTMKEWMNLDRLERWFEI